MRKETKKLIIMSAVFFVAGVAAMCAVISATGGRFVGLLPGVAYGDRLRDGSISVDADSDELTAAAFLIAEYIKDGDYGALSDIVHPVDGVMFSPYATVSTQSARVFTAAELRSAERDARVYVWGVYDGSGEPIEMTVKDYFARFVFDRDYTRAKIIGIDRVVRSGNALENAKEVFSDLRYVELHIPATDAADMDWSTLRLGFAEYEGSLMLVLILHSEHTI